MNQLHAITADLAGQVSSAAGLLEEAAREHAPTTLGTAFNVEGSVLIHLAAELGLEIEIFTVDTGRLPAETHAFADRIRARYNRNIRFYAPRAEDVEDFVTRHGSCAFRQQVDLRKGCCAIRKVAPLDRALAGKNGWITGLRRGQSAERAGVQTRTWESYYELYKYAPLADWTQDMVWAFVRSRDIPYHPYYDEGYTSIGCAPCTRAVTPGEDPRAGRWWWEHADESKECGMHTDTARRPIDWTI